MKLQRSGYAAGIALTALLAVTACGSDNEAPSSAGGASTGNASCVAGDLQAQGSTAQKNAMDEWIKAYQGQCSDAKINYNGTGSGAGIEAFISGTADFAGSDSALKEDEQPQADAKCAGGQALNLPMVIGPIAVVYNVDGVDNLQLSPATLAGIFAGKITKWNDAAIAAENSGAKLPATPIQTVHRSDESGTTDNFTKFLSKTAESVWTFGNAKAWKAPGGTGAAKSDGVATQVKSTPGTISYVELSFAENSELKKAKIKNGAGEFTELTGESAGKTIAGAKVTGTGNDLKMEIDYLTKEPGAYPIVLVTYEIACSKGSPKAAAIKGFLTYTASTAGQQELGELGYAPLPETVRAKVETSVASIS
ncbi:phosphate ABC transporter substrate-binding protein PstS [Jidongwangia harbinensis]|uniref:phosphate ABC transporter substrate-binding protein PstS n=1 Tax=Jidongwangia harbinensis TaxID=2878561 RepID=UPI001CD9A9CB|nr:phosphate ABC transporter substrate-binding protein PstS [Jidongwangia harbinensis]MCA2213653.1 phosphate ABC transporter substrate-binding protein PstS [Jidongwangia harbinensis]